LNPLDEVLLIQNTFDPELIQSREGDDDLVLAAYVFGPCGCIPAMAYDESLRR
jgi:hypothetical protein